jgi:hypothetical protein
MKASRIFRISGWIAAGITIVGAIFKIMHVFPQLGQLYLVGLLLFSMTEFTRFAFLFRQIPQKNWTDYLRLTAYGFLFVMIVLCFFGISEFLIIALLLMACTFFIDAFFHNRQPVS